MGEARQPEHARQAVEALARRLGLEDRTRRFEAHRWSGAEHEQWPVLHLEDVSAIPFVSCVPGVEEYQHRARVRADDRSLFAAVTPPSEGYEAYCRERLGLGSPEFILAEVGDHAFAVAEACSRGAAFERIVERARDAGGLYIHPYMAIETVWELARLVASSARVPVEVIGPPPPVLWLANDKGLLTEVVRAVLGEEWTVETHASSDPREMARHLLRLAERHAQVGLKRTRCASAMGNAVYDLRKIGKMEPDQILSEVRKFLERTEWALDEEVLIVAWEQTDDSPSTQMWIPPLEVGPPVVEGVYEQLLEGDEKIFLGSRPSQLRPEINRALADSSMLVGTALQALGYTGRCSFDFIVVEEKNGSFRARFVECNGRWGGTSTPMRLVDRLVQGPRPFYRAQDYMHHDLKGVSFSEVLRRVGEAAHDPATGRGRYVFYNVGPLARTGKLDVLVFGESKEDVDEAIAGELPGLLGLEGG